MVEQIKCHSLEWQVTCAYKIYSISPNAMHHGDRQSRITGTTFSVTDREQLPHTTCDPPPRNSVGLWIEDVAPQGLPSCV